MFRDIINRLEQVEKEIKDLKHEKAQAEQVAALIMKCVGQTEFKTVDLFNADFRRVRFLSDKESGIVKVFYYDDGEVCPHCEDIVENLSEHLKISECKAL